MFGTYSYNNSDTAVTNNQMYTIGRKLDLTGNSTVTSWVANHTASDDGAAGWWWLRSPRTAYSSSYAAAGVRSGGTLGGNCGYNTTGGVRPALVVNIQNLPST